MASFIGTKKLEEYKSKTQSEITETGTKIKSIYWDEEITIKKTYLNTNDYILQTKMISVNSYYLVQLKSKKNTP